MACLRFYGSLARPREILHYIEARNPAAAARVMDRLETECHQLARASPSAIPPEKGANRALRPSPAAAILLAMKAAAKSALRTRVELCRSFIAYRERSPRQFERPPCLLLFCGETEMSSIA